jgi:hypothetical protein
MIGSKILGIYKNGNYKVLIADDGTKIRYNNVDHFEPEFPESIDCKISNRCDRGCPMCHEQSCPNGALADLNHPLFESLQPYTELALGGGNILEHPSLLPFLNHMRAKKVICNITLHLDHFIENASRIKLWHDIGLVHGVGVSVNTVPTERQMMILCSHSDIVVHCIAGIVPMEALQKMSNRGLKLLILGYKNYGRGKEYQKLHPEIEKNIAELAAMLPELRQSFNVISFDNLAIEQLGVSNLVSKEEWDTNYMGNDGEFTMYLDMVKEEYAKSSTSDRKPIFSNDIRALFAEVRNENAENF